MSYHYRTHSTPVFVGNASQPAYAARFGAAAAVQLHANSSAVQKAQKAHADAAKLQAAANAAKAKAIAADAKLAASLQRPHHGSAVGAVAYVPVKPSTPQVVVLYNAPLPQQRLILTAAAPVYHQPVVATHNVTHLLGGHVIPGQHQG
jgi:N-acetylmuramoyl-L-alanine amidase